MWNTSHSLRILLIVVTRGTCQPQSHDARLAADPTPLCVTGWWVTGDGGQWFAIRCAGGAAPPFSVSFRTHLPPSAGIAAVARSPLPQPPCHTADYPTTYKLALKSLSRGTFNYIIIDITDNFTHVG